VTRSVLTTREMLHRGVSMRKFMAGVAMIAMLGMGGAAQAQSQNTAIEGRVDRLEHEMRAVQRKVFPGGAGQTVEPQITAPQTPETAPGVPASPPLADLTARVAALESQVQTLTGDVEQSQYRMRQLEDAFNAYRRTTDARLKALEDTASTVGAAPTAVDVAPVVPPKGKPTPAKPAGKPVPDKTVATVADLPAAPVAAAAPGEIEKPSTGDPAEDQYLYGYRLWQAKRYKEARTELEAVGTKYPNSRRASYANNLLGRAYLDDNAPAAAARVFYSNYKDNPKGERAPDSLYFLAQSLVKLKKPAPEVCRVYDEIDKAYGATLSAELKTRVTEGRAASKCD